MKKCTSLLLSLLLLISASGMSFTVHFCGDRIASISSALIADSGSEGEAEQCCIDKAKKNEPCCSDKELSIKSKPEPVSKQDYQKLAFIAPEQELQPFSCLVKIRPEENLVRYYCEPNGPPLYKLYHKFVFYA